MSRGALIWQDVISFVVAIDIEESSIVVSRQTDSRATNPIPSALVSRFDCRSFSAAHDTTRVPP